MRFYRGSGGRQTGTARSGSSSSAHPKRGWSALRGLGTLPNVFLTPHIAGSLGDEVHRMGEFMADELERFLRGDALMYEVCEAMLLTSQTKSGAKER